MLGLPATRMREKPNTSANTAYARPLPTATTPQAPTVPGLRLAGCATRRRAGMVPGTATATATAMGKLLTPGAIYAAGHARRPTGATAPQARTVPGLRLAGCAAVRVPEVARTATLTTPTAIRAASGGGPRLRRLRRRRPTCKVAGGLAGRQRRRRMLRALGAPMHTARRAKRPPGVMPGLRSLNNFYLIYFV